MTSAKIIADSINILNERCTTFVISFPRIILAEVNTHRMASKNSGSSRSQPSKVLLEKIKNHPFIPSVWPANGKGMQPKSNLEDGKEAESLWLQARDQMLSFGEKMAELGVHKQITNRLLEPWMYVTQITTATNWENMFALRAHTDAQQEFQELAFLMLDEYNKSEPKSLQQGEWHIPFGDRYVDDLTTEDQIKVAVARAARVSYENFDGEIDYEKDFILHDRLKEQGHWSPFEHVAMCQPGEQWGNLKGFKQYRKLFNNENRSEPRVVKKSFQHE